MARYALIIGIAEYMGSFKSLETPVQNANAIAEILDRYGDFNQVKRLPFRREVGQKDLGIVIRKPLSHATLVQELQQFLQDANGSDVLLYYSGHGFTKVDPLSNTPEGFLAPSDCQVELNAAGQIVAEKNGISLAGLNALINRHTFNSLVVILDCCNAGAFLESSMVRRDVTAFGYERDYYLITACRSSSKAYEGEEYSLLTAAVLKGLAQTNAAPSSGRISGDRLFDVIGNELQNSRQEPIRMGWGRLITLVRYLQPPQNSESVAQSFNPANPYMGLKPFEREQAAYFFGREQAVRALLDRLAENRFLAVIGPSGCGKSSLVKAGLLPELERDRIPGSHDWQVEIITPGQYPLQALTNALERHRSDVHPLVLFVDQFEELFTLCPHEEEQRTFIKRLDQETNDPDRQTRIIIALRGDFLDRCAKFQESADLINTTAPTTYIVTPLTEAKLVAELEESITCPAGLHGVSFEQGLVARIVDDVINQPGAMPLLQYALTQLWDTCISSNGVSQLLTIQSYDVIEGVKGALQRWADQFYTNLSPDDQAFVRELMSELVQLGDDGEVTRRRASWERLRDLASSQEQLDRIIGRLVYQRLLVADGKTVEVAHEALLKESRLIQGWIEDNRESIRLQQRLEVYRREWEEHDRSKNYLLDAGRLAAIDEWIERKQPRLTNGDQAFVRLSRERRDLQVQSQLEQERRLREEAEARETAEIEKKLEAEARAEAETKRAIESIARAKADRQKTRLAIGGGTLVTVLIAALGFFGVQSAQRQEQIATAGAIETLVGVAETYYNTHTQIEALIASIRALWKLKKFSPNDTKTLDRIKQVISGIHEKNRFEDHSDIVFAVSFSPKGSFIASGGNDKFIRIWKPDGSLIKLARPMQHKATIWNINFSPNGEIIVSGDKSGIIRIWTKEGVLLDTIKGHEKDVNGVIFSPDNRKIISASSDKTAKIWSFSQNSKKILSEAPLILPHNSIVWMASFSPDGRLIASAVDKQAINIWKSDGTLLTTLIGHTATVRYVSFSSDSRALVSASDDNTVRIWQWQNEQKRWTSKVVTDRSNKAYVAKFSPDNEMIATTGANGTIQRWRSKDFSKLTPFGRHMDQTMDLAFSPDGKQIASAGRDKIVRIWNSDSINTASQISIDDLLIKSCSWIADYLETNSTAKRSYSDVKKICDNV